MSLKLVQLWHIYFVRDCRHTRPKPKDKFVIPVCMDGEKYMGFLINSEIRDFARNNHELLQCNAYIREADHSALDYDSYVCIEDLYEFTKEELQIYKCHVSPDAKKVALQTIRVCKRIERMYKKIILEDAGETYP